jgi:hypothetical protein
MVYPVGLNQCSGSPCDADTSLFLLTWLHTSLHRPIFSNVAAAMVTENPDEPNGRMWNINISMATAGYKDWSA